MRADYLTRWQGNYRAGLHRLRTEGTVIERAWHDHAATVTATGHATISTGCLPSRHGITGNTFYDRLAGKSVRAVEDDSTALVGGAPDIGASPKYLLHSTIGDWLKEKSPESKVICASFKDRAAVLLGGQRADGVYWYDSKTGNFVTSNFYSQTLDPVVEAFNTSGVKDIWKDSIWAKVDSMVPYEGADTVAEENDGVHTYFPHSILPDGDTSQSAYFAGLWSTPFADDLVLRFCEELVTKERLGADSIPDLLGVSLSAADIIGHAYGPHSQEVEDYYRRLDEYLARFLRHLDKTVGKGSYVLVLTSDHGVCPFPEIEIARGNHQARRVLSHEFHDDVRDALRKAFPQRPEAEMLVEQVAGGFMVTDSLGLDASARVQVAAAIESIDYVSEVYLHAELAADTVESPVGRRFKNGFHPDRAPDLMVSFSEWVLISESAHGTTHGTPYRYDTDVPLIFFGRAIAHRDEAVRTVDIAPTLAAILGVEAPPDVDGRALRPASSSAP
jgi:predicted AlkP superfamily pyrophosphatase or phosphodiesterase